MSNQQNPQSFDALASGRSNSDPFITFFSNRDPNQNDINYPVQKRWFNTELNNEWILVSFTSFNGLLQANWQPVSQSSADLLFLSGNSGGMIAGDAFSNINVIGDTTTINIVGNPVTHTLTASTTGSIATSYVTDVGTAVPIAGILNVTGATVAAGSTPLQTVATGANTVQVQAQISQAIASTNASSIGLASFNSANFNVDANGFVTSTGNFTSIAIQTFTTSGTYTPTSGMLYCIIEVLGSGGGGGGAASTSAVQTSAAGGGGGGEYARGVFSAATIGVSQTITINPAGAGGIGNAVGGTGGSTSVGALISAFGGAGGHGSAAFNLPATAFNAGGFGGSGGTGGSVRVVGTEGSYGLVNSTIGGAGGATIYSPGAYIASNTDGQLAPGSGGGGGGASSHNSTAFNGGPGSSGIVVVTEYI